MKKVVAAILLIAVLLGIYITYPDKAKPPPFKPTQKIHVPRYAKDLPPIKEAFSYWCDEDGEEGKDYVVLYREDGKPAVRIDLDEYQRRNDITLEESVKHFRNPEGVTSGEFITRGDAVIWLKDNFTEGVYGQKTFRDERRALIERDGTIVRVELYDSDYEGMFNEVVGSLYIFPGEGY